MKINNWLVEFLVLNTFIFIPIYVALLTSGFIFILSKFIKAFFWIEKVFIKTEKLCKLIDDTMKLLNQSSYQLKQDQKETLEKMKNIRELLEKYFSALLSIKDRFEKTEDKKEDDKK